MNYLLVMAGGAIGSAARYGVGRLATRWISPDYPWGTLTVNIVGGLLMGMLVGVLARMTVPQENWRLFAAIGVLGGFTTFSSFALDTVYMIERGAIVAALGYIAISVVGAIGGVMAGLAITRALA